MEATEATPVILVGIAVEVMEAVAVSLEVVRHMVPYVYLLGRVATEVKVVSLATRRHMVPCVHLLRRVAETLEATARLLLGSQGPASLTTT